MNSFKPSLILSALSIFLLGTSLLSLATQTNSFEKRTKVAIIDTGLRVDEKIKPYLCSKWAIDITGNGVQDDHGHGTNIANIIARGMNKTKQCLLIVKWYDGKIHTPEELVTLSTDAMLEAVQEGAKVVNFSGGGESPYVAEEAMYHSAIKVGTIVVVSAGNEHKDLSKECNYYPACYAHIFKNKNFHVVANYKDNIPTKTSNYNGPVTDIEDGTEVTAGGVTMSGTSQAAALRTARILREDFNR